MGVAIRNLETQLGQLATIVNERPNGSLPNNTVSQTFESIKGKKQVKAVGLRGEKHIDSDEKDKEAILNCNKGFRTSEVMHNQKMKNLQFKEK